MVKGVKIPKREPELEETREKNSLVIKGNKSNNVINQVLHDLHRMRYPNSVLYSRKHVNLNPFELVD